MRKNLADVLPNGKMLKDSPVGIVVCGDREKAHDRQISYLLQDLQCGDRKPSGGGFGTWTGRGLAWRASTRRTHCTYTCSIQSTRKYNSGLSNCRWLAS